MDQDTFLKERDTWLRAPRAGRGNYNRNIPGGLPAEDLDSVVSEDADHWLAIYRELIGFKRFLL